MDNITETNAKMIWKIASHFYGIDKNDLYQAGVVGLLKALENYQKDSNTKFTTYAYDYIFGEMYALANNKNIKISKDILKLYKKIEETRYILAQKLGKIPSNYELSQFLNINIDDINMACSSANVIMSLDNNLDGDRSYYEMLGEEMDLDTKILIDEGMSVLNEDEKNIIKSRYFEDLNQSEVAKKLNMTQVMVSRYEKKGIAKMRKYLTL